MDVIERKKHPAHRDRSSRPWSVVNALSANANYEVVQHTVATSPTALDEGPGRLFFFGFDPGDKTVETCSRPPANGWPLGLIVDAEADFSALAELGIGVDVNRPG